MLDEQRDTKSFFIGLLAGGLLGGLAGLLFASKSGKEFRKDISEKTGEVIEGANQIIENVREKASDIILDAKKKAENLYDEGKSKLK